MQNIVNSSFWHLITKSNLHLALAKVNFIYRKLPELIPTAAN